jgi:hypothetical protein
MDPIQEQPQQPISPELIQSQGMPSDGGQPISEEQRQTLFQMIAKVKEALKSLEATSFASSNKTDALRRDLLRQVFEKLQIAGVDLTSRESVANFIMKLQEENPELASMFEEAMNKLLGDQNGGAFGNPEIQGESTGLEIPPENNMNNVNQNETVPESE